LKDLSDHRHLSYAPFPVNSISPENWVDECHTNAKGYWEKANYLAPFARRLLNK
jgi:hypothetical protein